MRSLMEPRNFGYNFSRVCVPDRPVAEIAVDHGREPSRLRISP